MSNQLSRSLRNYAEALLDQGSVYPSGAMSMAADRIEQLYSRIDALESALADAQAELAEAQWALTQSWFANIHIMGNDDNAYATREEQYTREKRYDAVKKRAKAALAASE